MSAKVQSIPQTYEFKPLCSTGVDTFTLVADPSRKNDSVDLHIVYIAKILDEGRDIRVRPLCISKECFTKATVLKSKKLIATLENSKDFGLLIRVHKSVESVFSKDTVISVESGDKVIQVGKLKGYFGYEDDRYQEIFLDSFDGFLAAVRKALDAVKRQ